jgi:hypothetical protein
MACKGECLMKHGGLFSKAEVNQAWTKTYDSNIEGLVVNSDNELLLHFDGADGQTVTVDSSVNAVGITMSGTELDTGITYAPAFNSTCLFPGTGYVTHAANAAVNLWRSPNYMTCEFFVKHSSLAGVQVYYSQTAPGYTPVFYHQAGVGLACNNGVFESFANVEITDTNWHHVLYYRYNSSPAYSVFYLDGQQCNYHVQNGSPPGMEVKPGIIGARAAGSPDYLLGTMDEFRISKGNIYSLSPNPALTDSFTPPTAPYAPDTYNPMVITVDPTYTGFYHFKIYIVNAYNGVSSYYMALLPEASYRRSEITVSGASVTGYHISSGFLQQAGVTPWGWFLGSVDDLGGVTFIDLVVASANGVFKSYTGTVVNRVSGGINQQLLHISGTWETTLPVTHFILLSDRTRGLGAGTRVIMYKSIGE